jgi:phosphatidylserine/phosphatidylglycerophosphate/cardiolipin synthase-like enzyme
LKAEKARRNSAEVSRQGRQALTPRRPRAPAAANPIADLRREFAEQGFQRIGGGRLVTGNRLRVLRDARENYPAWIAAIESARRTIHLEMYIVHDDVTGRRFRDLLVARARAGVTVRVLYDWFGSLRLVGRGFWTPLRAAGGEVRVANPPSLDSLLGWVSRDHRKLLTIDGSEAFISGLCIGDAWVGDPARGIAPWRDTGVQLIGPAVADAEAAFAGAWALAGSPISPAELPRHERIPAAGSVTLRVIASAPETTELYRMDLLVAVAARERLWLTDAYFMATPPYRQALRSAALDGVDVRLLVPHASDIEWIANVSRTMYRSLLEAGVRVYEWNGPMVHAKTAVADERWTRIGSTNLNVSSWLGNWELDVCIEDEGIARESAEMFLDDLTKATEVVITPRNKVRPHAPGPRTPSELGSSSRAVRDAARMGSILGAAVKGHRTLERGESRSLVTFAGLLLVLALVAVLLPRLIAYPIAALSGVTGGLLLLKAVRLHRGRRRQAVRGTER